MTYRVEVITDSTGEWYCNGLAFDTVAEAETYGKDIFLRWTSVKKWRVVPTTQALHQIDRTMRRGRHAWEKAGKSSGTLDTDDKRR